MRMESKIYHISKERVNINSIFPLSVENFIYSKKAAISAHTHAFCEIGITIGGVASHEIGDTYTQLSRGSIYIIPKGVSHRIRIMDHWQMINVYFLPELIELNLDVLIRLYGMFPMQILGFVKKENQDCLISSLSEQSLNSILGLIECVRGFTLSESLHKSLFNRNCFMNMLMVMAQDFRCKNDYFSDKRVSHVILDIHENIFLDTKEIIHLVSNNLTLTSQYVNTIFSNEVACNISEYIIKSKILRSCNILLDRRNTVTDVALALAFYDHSHYIKYFKKYIGLSPSEYINKYALPL